MDTKFSTYHTIRALILEFVEPYIVKLIDPSHPDASWDGYELWQAVDNNHLEFVKIYHDMYNTETTNISICTAIQRNYADIIDYLLPFVSDHYYVMIAAVEAKNVDLMARIYEFKPQTYWNSKLEPMEFAGRPIQISSNDPVDQLIRKWFLS